MLILGINPLDVAAAIRRRRQAACVAVLFLISGATGLVYQVIWTRKLVLLFGTTAHAVSAVLAVYFVGLALGSLWGGRLADRTRVPLLWYGLFEMAIGAWAAGFLAFSEWSESIIASLLQSVAMAPHAGIALRAGLALAFLAIPTTLMGATLPLLARYAAGDEPTRGMRIGALYSINTLGAVAGCAAAGFWLLPRFGYSGATWIAAGGNGLVGLGAFWLGWGMLLPGYSDGTPETPPAENRISRYILAAFALSGGCALALEVIWTRLLTVVFLGTTYAFTTMLVSLLCGLAVGSAAGAGLSARIRNPLLAFGVAEGLAGISCVAFLPLFAALPERLQTMQMDTGFQWEGIIRVKFMLSFLVLFGPTCLFGATFPLAVQAYRRAGVGGDVGRLYSANTLGGVAGSLAGGFLFIPILGAHQSIVCIACLLLIIGLFLVFSAGTISLFRKSALACFMSVLMAAAVLRTPGNVAYALNAGYLPKSDRLLHMREGVEGVVAVSEPPENTSESNRILWINGVQATASIEKGVKMNRFQGVLPLLFDRDPRLALFMCFGSGITCGTLALHDFDRIDAVEISKDVLGAAPLFAKDNCRVLSNPRVRFIVDDGRNFLLTTRERYDVITFEPMPLALAGVSAFYTREYYRLCLGRLAPGGLVSQWVPLHSLDPDIVRSLTATFAGVFPECCAWFINADLFLIGSDRPLHISPDQAVKRLKAPVIAQALSEVGLDDPVEVMSCFFMSKEKIQAYVRGGAIMTDDRPWAEFEAPKRIFARTVDKTLEQLEPYFESPIIMFTANRSPNENRQQFSEAIARRHAAKKEVLKGLKHYYGGTFGSRPETYFKQALAYDPDDRTAQYYLKEITFARISTFRSWNELDKAVESVQDALRAAPHLQELQLALADLYHDMNRTDEARAAYQAYLAAGGKVPRALERGR